MAESHISIPERSVVHSSIVKSPETKPMEMAEYFTEESTRFVNCTIVANQASAGGVSILFSGESITLENSIMWANNATQANEIR